VPGWNFGEAQPPFQPKLPSKTVPFTKSQVPFAPGWSFGEAGKQWPPACCAGATPLLGTIKYERIARHTAELVYKRLREEAGVHRSREARYQPRLHDFRHTFAVIRLVTWYREGKYVQRLLPHLATYLGHCRVQDTARYLTMTAELLEEASRCFERYARPEVSHV
jgi:integrase